MGSGPSSPRDVSRVVHLTIVHPRSDTRIALKQTPALAAGTRHAVTLMVADGKGGDAGAAVPVVDLGQLPARPHLRAAHGILRSFRAVLRDRPHLVHFHDPELLPLGFLAKLSGIKVVYDVHEDVPQLALSREWVPRSVRVLLAATLTALEWVAARTFDAVVTATPRIAERFPGPTTVTVQNFPILAELAPPAPLPHHERPRAFAYVGGLSTERGAREMVRAFAELGQPGATLELAGAISPATLEAELRNDPGWARVNRFEMLSRPEVAALFGRVRAGLVLFHALPNHVRAQPNKMFEYMSAGLPVIASDFPLWRQIIGGAGCGLLVDPGDPSAIAGALRWVLDHPEEAEAMGERGRQAVQDTYNWNIEAEKLLDLYKRLLGPGSE